MDTWLQYTAEDVGDTTFEELPIYSTWVPILGTLDARRTAIRLLREQLWRARVRQLPKRTRARLLQRVRGGI